MTHNVKEIEENLLKIMSDCMDKVNSIKMKKTEFKADGTIVTETDKKIHNAIEIFIKT